MVIKKSNFSIPVIIIAFSVLLMFFGMDVYAADAPQINDSEITVFPGEQYKLNVTLGDNDEISEFDYRVNESEGLSASADIQVDDNGYVIIGEGVSERIEVSLSVDLIYRTKILKKSEVTPSASPTSKPSAEPTVSPTSEAVSTATVDPSASPTANATPTAGVESTPTATPSATPSVEPTTKPTSKPEYTYSELKKVSKNIKIIIVPIDFTSAFSPIAKGVSRGIFAVTYTGVTFQGVVYNPEIADVSDNGTITGKNAGNTVVKTIIKVADKTFEQEFTLYVTDPAFIRSEDAITEWGTVSVTDLLSGICDNTIVTELKSSKKKKLKVENNILTGLKKCDEVVITCVADGRPLTCTFEVTTSRPKGAIKKKDSTSSYYYYSCIPVILQKGKKSTFKATGMSENSHMTFKMDKNKIATVSAKGVVKAKKYGSTHFVVNIDYRDYYITTVVAKKKAVQVLKKAYTALGANYSQPRRMQKNYYDCSSLVWRSFSPYGVKFGQYNWAPTAAMEANYMYHHGKMKYFKGVSYKKLKPGDILFFGDCKKGWFGGIHHTAIYVGDDTYIHAAGRAYGVIQSNYSSRKSSVGCIARPLKAD